MTWTPILGVDAHQPQYDPPAVTACWVTTAAGRPCSADATSDTGVCPAHLVELRERPTREPVTTTPLAAPMVALLGAFGAQATAVIVDESRDDLHL